MRDRPQARRTCVYRTRAKNQYRDVKRQYQQRDEYAAPTHVDDGLDQHEQADEEEQRGQDIRPSPHGEQEISLGYAEKHFRRVATAGLRGQLSQFPDEWSL